MSSTNVAAESLASNPLDKKPEEHFRDWPNEAGFNASTEQKEPIKLVVKGRLPPCVAGTLYRTGPGHYQVDDTPKGTFKMSHWFDGFSQVHRFQLTPTDTGSCSVTYNSRRQVDTLIDRIRETGKLDYVTFGQKRDPCATFFQKLKTTFNPRRSADPYLSNVGVTISTNPSGFQSLDTMPNSETEKKRRLVVKTDNNVYKEIHPDTLEPIGVTDQSVLHPSLIGPLSCAHPEYDPQTGDLFNYNLEFGSTSTYRIFRTSFATGKTDILATISKKDVPPAYIHSFFLTEDFVVLAVWASRFSGYGAKILWERNVLDAIVPFDEKATTQWVVVDRRHGCGVVSRFESKAMFAFHTVNAWQAEDSEGNVDLICEVVQFQNMDILHRFYYENLVSTAPGVSQYAGEARKGAGLSLTRYRLGSVPIGASKIKASGLKAVGTAEIVLQLPHPLIGELPTINPLYSTKKSRYIYALSDEGHSSFMDGIVKLDTTTKKALYWKCEKHTPGEAIFVPDPTREEEDAGYLLSVVLDGLKGTSYLLCLDAQIMKEVGRAVCEIAVGFGFHGTHVAS